ncbi:hypothetical protein BDN70DRAFT_882958 [Pholiota conissans]|uniref:Heterokaryon incompatibility domain-containing protein n=1 Tax=Pholiota conissans TaxID=109636 RepID=A0A9P6CQN4_9AGAR|nr:hypothetical protein BDN70DRAFT_882958 [Pholiota conissans]
MVIKALKNFIVPIIQAQSLVLGKQFSFERSEWHYLSYTTATVHSCVGVSQNVNDEALDLIAALNKFVTALMHPSSVPKDSARKQKCIGKSLESESNPNLERSVDGRSEINTVSSYHLNPPLLQKAIDMMRYQVFNEMPIRLLAFDTEGSHLELVERSEISRRIALQMQRDFDQNFAAATDLTQPASAERDIRNFNSQYLRFAILSHTWIQDATQGEITYTDWNLHNFDRNSIGYQKVANFCRAAANDYGVSFGWMDTICINKESSSELDESIRSMFKWYSRAHVCITYLGCTTAPENMRLDPWFMRGWTLQELLAPRNTKFYTADWRKLNTTLNHDLEDDSIVEEIRTATTITKYELTQPLPNISISRKMQWAAYRRVTRAEDVAYSLMGIFGVSMSTAYGEGAECAFARLIKEILEFSRHSLDLVNFGYRQMDAIFSPSKSVLLPSRPDQYLLRVNVLITWPLPSTPVTITHLGLRVTVLLMPGCSKNISPLRLRPLGGYHATAAVQFVRSGIPESKSIFNLLDASIYTESQDRNHYLDSWDIVFFGVLNFLERPSTVDVPDGNVCFAKPLLFKNEYVDLETLVFRTPSQHQVLFTKQPVAFQLRSTNGEDDSGAGIKIPKNELRKHGMYLRTMYL